MSASSTAVRLKGNPFHFLEKDQECIAIMVDNITVHVRRGPSGVVADIRPALGGPILGTACASFREAAEVVNGLGN